MARILSKFKLNNSFSSPEIIDYDILGLHKKRVIVKGELKTIEYYQKYDGTTYSDLIVKETRTYTRDSIGLVAQRTLTSEWYLKDETVGLLTTNIKYYAPNEAIEEGITRRNNIIADAKIYCLGTIGQSYGFDF